ncbi:MAG: WGR domain-containing protein, partial [Ferruginibacter sp.]|nr:WGR domain-containing protein [Cytophagales bacterium]
MAARGFSGLFQRMKFIQQASLWFSEGTADKVYEVDLCEVSAGQFVVNFRYGRRGTALRDGTKTTLPVPEAQARKIYDQLVGSKTREGYREAGGPASTTAPPPAVGTIPPADRPAYLLELLRSSLPSGTLPKTTRWPLGRLIWRTGELRLREAVPFLLALLPKSDDLRQYCLAWALGRCGDPAAIPALERLHAGSASSDKVRRIALVSWLALAKGDARASVVARVADRLPSALRAALTVGNEASRRNFLTGDAGKTLVHDHVETLYLLSEDHPPAHAVVVEWLTTVPFSPNTFRQVRHLFKVAEFREDARVFGVLAYRFEKTPATFRYASYGNQAILDGKWLEHPRRELARKDSRLAYSNKTRAY